MAAEEGEQTGIAEGGTVEGKDQGGGRWRDLTKSRGAADIRVLGVRDAVLAVDVQNDFCPGGALAVRDGDRVVPVLNAWIREAAGAGSVVVAMRDWHPANHASFRDQGGPWPPHCVQGSPGAAFCPGFELPGDAILISKGENPQDTGFSGFDGTGLGPQLRARGVTRLWVGGLATDYCVRSTVLDALREGFEVHLLTDAIRAVEVSPGDGDRAIQEMKRAGAIAE